MKEQMCQSTYHLPMYMIDYIDEQARRKGMKKSHFVEHVIGEFIKAEYKINRIGTRYIDPIKED